MHPNRRARNVGRTAVAGLLAVILTVIGVLGCGSGRTKESPVTDAAVGGDAAAEQFNTVEGADTGVPPGVFVGGYIGHYMENQMGALARIEDAKTERMGDRIRVTWVDSTLFDYDSAMLRIGPQENLKKLAEVIRNYTDTDIVIIGYAGPAGPDEYIEKLSERRAMSVRNFLIDAGISPSRLTMVGCGELRFSAVNSENKTRRLNHFVEIEIRANDVLKARAAEADARGRSHQP